MRCLAHEAKQSQAYADEEEEGEHGGVIFRAADGHTRLHGGGGEQQADDGEDEPAVFGEKPTEAFGRAIAEQPEERESCDAEGAGQSRSQRFPEDSKIKKAPTSVGSMCGEDDGVEEEVADWVKEHEAEGSESEPAADEAEKVAQRGTQVVSNKEKEAEGDDEWRHGLLGSDGESGAEGGEEQTTPARRSAIGTEKTGGNSGKADGGCIGMNHLESDSAEAAAGDDEESASGKREDGRVEIAGAIKDGKQKSQASGNRMSAMEMRQAT